MKKYSYFHKPEYSHSKLNLNHEKHKYSVSSVVSEEGLEPPIKGNEIWAIPVSTNSTILRICRG